MEKQHNSNESFKPRASRFLETSLSVKPFSDASNIKVKLTLWSDLHVTNVTVQSNGLHLVGDVKFSSKNIADIQLKLMGERGDIEFKITLSDASSMGLSLFAIKGEKYVYVAEDSYDRAIDLQKVNELSRLDYIRYKNPKFFAQQPQRIPQIATKDLKPKQIYHLHGRIKWEDCQGKIHDLIGCLYSILGYGMKMCDKNGNIVKDSPYTSQFGRYDLYFLCSPDTIINFIVSAEIKNAIVTNFKEGYGYGVCLLACNAKEIRDIEYNFVIRDTYKNEKHVTSIPEGYNYLMYDDGTVFTAALQITQALYFGFKYVAEMNDGKQLEKTQVLFPRNVKETDDNGSFASGFNIYLADNAYKAWDVILHEFGHVIQYQYDIANSPGGEHYSSRDDIEERGKDNGIRLAWGESWPTVFSIRITQYFRDRFKLQDYPYIADEKYDANNSDDESWWGYSLEEVSDFLYGEGCERNIMRVLYDMIDDKGKKSDDLMSMADRAFWNLLMESKAKTFSQFMEHVYKKFGTNDNHLNSILMTHGFTPRDIKVKDGTLCYTLPGKANCPQSLHNESKVYYFPHLNDLPVAIKKGTIKQSNQASCELPMDMFYNSNSRYFYAQVCSYQTNKPKTGPYYSRKVRLQIPRHYKGVFMIAPSEFKFLTDRKQHSNTSSIGPQYFTFEGFNAIYQNSNVLVSDPDNVGYSQLIIETTTLMIHRVKFIISITKKYPTEAFNPKNKIIVSYLDNSRKEHEYKTEQVNDFRPLILPNRPFQTYKTYQHFTIDFKDAKAKGIVLRFRNFAQDGKMAGLNVEVGNIYIDTNEKKSDIF